MRIDIKGMNSVCSVQYKTAAVVYYDLSKQLNMLSFLSKLVSDNQTNALLWHPDNIVWKGANCIWEQTYLSFSTC